MKRKFKQFNSKTVLIYSENIVMSNKKINFTKTTLANLPAASPGKRNCYYDSKIEGLELRVTSAGTKSFSVYRWINGHPQRVVLGRYNPEAVQSSEFNKDPLSTLANNPGLSIEQARQLASSVLIQITLGKNPLSSRRTTGGITLGEMFKEYLHGYAVDHTKTSKQIEQCFYRYLDHWKNRTVSSIKRSDIQLLMNKLGQENGKTTANRTFELLRAIINKGKQWGLYEGENPAIGITKFKLKPRDRFVYEKELPRLIAAIEKEPKQDIKDYVLLSLYTGARKSNVLAMHWRDIDLDVGMWTIPDTKNDSAQTILLTAPELEILRRRFNARKSFEYVFASSGNSGHLVDPKKGWYRILKRAGISNLHLHDLRRTLGSYMAMTGASLSVIGNALNHKDLSTTRKVYAHSARQAERNAREVAHQKMFTVEKTFGTEIVKIRKKNAEF
jgi:integrase